MIVPGSSREIQTESISRQEPDESDAGLILAFLTAEGLNSYFASGEDNKEALQLYEWNISAAAGVLKLTGIVETAFRKTLDQELHLWAANRPH